jgi:putative transposase
MTQTGDPLENAVAERINKTIKEEFTTERQMSFRSLKNVKESMDRIIDFYNTKRPHRSVEWYTPNNAHQKTGILKRQWKTYYKKQESQINKANKND